MRVFDASSLRRPIRAVGHGPEGLGLGLGLVRGMARRRWLLASPNSSKTVSLDDTHTEVHGSSTPEPSFHPVPSQNRRARRGVQARRERPRHHLGLPTIDSRAPCTPKRCEMECSTYILRFLLPSSHVSHASSSPMYHPCQPRSGPSRPPGHEALCAAAAHRRPRVQVGLEVVQ